LIKNKAHRWNRLSPTLYK